MEGDYVIICKWYVLGPDGKVQVFFRDTGHCPRCKCVNPPLAHMDRRKCECGLHMERAGNRLRVWV